jgi:hypothetical protein
MKDFFIERWEDIQDYLGGGTVAKAIGAIIGIYFLVAALIGGYWSFAPARFSVEERAQALLQESGGQPARGHATTATLIGLMETLLDKPGGYISNDVFPPGIWLDNISNWEFGVLVQVRDLARAMRKDISRSQSQSSEDIDLVIAEPQFNFDSESWVLPSTETEYRRGLVAMKKYHRRLTIPTGSDAQFYARADNLRNWLTDAETRLGSLSQRLSESVGKMQYDTSLAGEKYVTSTEQEGGESEVKTPWLEIDDVFYEARGTAWALIHILKAIEVDFAGVLKDKNAIVSLQQIIAELEGTQDDIWSPMILNGSGFGVLANHSLTMASYISRANAAIVDLRTLLVQG